MTHVPPIRIVSPPSSAESLGAWQYFRSRGARCTWSACGSSILAHRASTIDDADAVCEVGLIDPESCRFTPVGRTTAWSAADGARLQWLDAGRVVYNTRDDDDRMHATIATIDAQGRVTDRVVLEHPIHTVSPCASRALTIGFERFGANRPALAIAGLVDHHVTNPAPKHCGVCTIDLERGTRENLISLAELVHCHESELGEGRTHFVDDLSYSPGGTRVAIVHRFERADGISHARLITIDASGASDPRLLIEGRISRHVWIDEETLLVHTGRDAVERVRDSEGAEAITIVIPGVRAGGPMSVSPGDGALLAIEGRPEQREPTPLFLVRLAGEDSLNHDIAELGRHRPPTDEDDVAHADSIDRMDLMDMRAAIDPGRTRVCFDTNHEGVSAIGTIGIGGLCGCPDAPVQRSTEAGSRGAARERGVDIGLLEEARVVVSRLLRGAACIGGDA